MLGGNLVTRSLVGNRVVGGTWTASGTWTLPAFTAGLITATGRIIAAGGTSFYGLSSTTYHRWRGGIDAGGQGATIVLNGVNFTGSEGIFEILTPNASENGDLSRLQISGDIDTAVATWSAVTHTGFQATETAYTASGAITNNGAVSLNQSGSALAMTLADPGGAGKYLIITQIDSGTQGHTVTTATAGGFDGTNNTATFNAQYECLVLYSISSARWVIVENIGAVALSAV